MPFDVAKQQRVSADARKYALGAALLQQVSENHWRSVEYASRKMTEAETHYAQIKKESLAITWACEKFDYYLVGRKFQIETDHSPLVKLLGVKDLGRLPLGVKRFKLRLMRYDFDIFHTPGNLLLVTDSLSRTCSTVIPADQVRKCYLVETHVSSSSVEAMLRSVNGPNVDLRPATEIDVNSQRCVNYIQNGWPSDNSGMSEDLRKLFLVYDRLTYSHGVIFYVDCMYVPHALRLGYLAKSHEGHQGVGKT